MWLIWIVRIEKFISVWRIDEVYDNKCKCRWLFTKLPIVERWKFTFIRRYLHTNVFSEHFTEVNITMDRSPNWTGQLDTIFSNRKDILLCNLWIYRRLWRYLGQYSQYFDTLLDLKTWTVFTVKNRNILLVFLLSHSI